MSNTSEPHDTYQFNTGMQRRVLAMLVYDFTNIVTLSDIVKPEYFDNQVFQDLCRIVLEFYKKYKRAPYADEFAQQIGELLISKPFLPEDDYFGEFEKIREIGREGDYTFVYDQVTEFARYAAMKNALLAGTDILKTQRDYARVAKMVEQARIVGDSRKATGVDYFAELDQRLENRETGIERKALTIPTEIPRLDEFMNGGLMRTELGIIMGPMKRGKTIVAMNFSRAALVNGINVCHIVLEMGERRIADRYDSLISGIPHAEMKIRALEVKARVHEFFSRPGIGKLVIRHYPALTATSAEIENFITQTRTMRGIEPGLLIVDYLGLMANVSQTRTQDSSARYLMLGQHAKELISIAQKLNMGCWLIHQSTRASLTKDTVGLADSADSIEPIRDADIILTINQKASEAQNSMLRIYIAGGRDVEDKKSVVCRAHFPTYAISPLSEEEQRRYDHDERYGRRT